jgi:hypothetical protein
MKIPVGISVNIIHLDRGHCLITHSNETRSGSGEAMMYKTSYDKITKIHDAVTYARLWMTGDLNALPKTEEVTPDDVPQRNDTGRQLTIRSARNGYIVNVGKKTSPHRDWSEQFGDEILFRSLSRALKFCGDYLEGLPGTTWDDWDELRYG